MASQIGAMEGVTRQRRSPVLLRPNPSKRHHLQQQRQANVADKKVIASTYFSIEAFLVLACLTVSLLILPLVLPPLPPPPTLLLLLPVCLLILLIVLAFMPTDMRSMASSYLYTDELSRSLQKRDQDIINAMALVNLANDRMQQIMCDRWEEFLQENVTSFCIKYGIKVSKLDDRYMPYGRSSHFYPKQTNDDHFRREVYLGSIDNVLQELDNRFDKVNMELFVCMSALNSLNSFASYDRNKVLSLANFYLNDFSSTDLMRLSFQLDNFIDDMRTDDRFNGLKNLGELSTKLIETRKYDIYKLVCLLLKLILLLPMATTSVERVFLTMNLVKNILRNSMSD